MLDAEDVYDELLLSYSLLFSRDLESQRIAQNLFSPRTVDFLGINDRPRPGTVVVTKWEMYFGGQTPMVTHFSCFGGHLALLRHQMTEWKPEHNRDLFQPGYKDRFMWYATLLGGLIAILGIIGIITSVISATTSIVAINLARRSLCLQLNQTLNC